MTYPVRVVPFKLMVHPDGRTASITGAHPGEGFEIQQRGWTCENSDGTRGRGQRPWYFFRAAQAYVDQACPAGHRQPDDRGDERDWTNHVSASTTVTLEMQIDLSGYEALVHDMDLTSEPSAVSEQLFRHDVRVMATRVLGPTMIECRETPTAVLVTQRVPSDAPAEYLSQKRAAVAKGLAECLDRAGLQILHGLKAQP